jgi:hypothetical protein
MYFFLIESQSAGCLRCSSWNNSGESFLCEWCSAPEFWVSYSQHCIDCMSSSTSSSSRCALPPGYELYLWMCSGAQRDPVTGLKSPYASRNQVAKRQRRYRAIRTTKQIETQEMQPGFMMFCEILTNKNLHLSSSFCGSDPKWFIDSQIAFHNHVTRDDWAIIGDRSAARCCYNLYCSSSFDA